jgi:hypothetical protein
MESRERNSSLAKGRLHALCRVVCCFVAAIPVLAEEPPATVWEGVQARAAASGDPKAIGRELKALPPEELLACGEALSREMQENGGEATAVIVPVNAILSYHANKAGYDATASAIGGIIAESGNPYWVYGALEWIENNHHWRGISPDGFRAIAEGMLAVLGNPRGNAEVFLVVLKKCGSEDIIGNFAAEDRRKVSEKCGEILKTATNESIRTQAAKTVRELERISADAGD